MRKTFYVAMYLRLSRDDMDGNVKSESNSINSQREMIRSFIMEQEDMELYDVYVDDGFTGSNFERPDFKRMINDIEAGKINCIIVKDLSRFGREYIEMGRFLQKIFPKQGVRFIAITDHFDSKTADNSESSIVLPVKNFINDSYCRDISTKVRSQKQIKRINGEFIGPFATYGYQKDPQNKNKLVIDEYAAHVVKNIFEWKINGISASAIAKKLNELGILSPMSYKKSLGENFKTGFTGKAKTNWQAVTIKRILTNEIYIGHMVQGKKEKVNYKIAKLIEKPESEWIKVENTHELIIEADEFHIVQNLLRVDMRATASSENGDRDAHEDRDAYGDRDAHGDGDVHGDRTIHGNIFSGLLFCGHCKEQLVQRITRYKGQEKVSYICSTYNRGEGCSRHRIPENELKAVVFQECRTYSNIFLEQASLLNEIKQKEANFEIITRYDHEIERLRREQDKYYKLASGLYEDLRKGILTKMEFEKLHNYYTEINNQLGEAINNQELLIKKLFRQGIAAGTRLERFKECLELKELDRPMLVNLVHRIYFYGNGRLEIEFNFYNEYLIATALNQSQMEGREKYA